MTTSEVQLTGFDSSKLTIYYQDTNEELKTTCASFEFFTHVGRRQNQEDRICVIPRLFADNISLVAVFDGTVGPHAAEFAQKHFTQHLISSPAFQHAFSLINPELYASIMSSSSVSSSTTNLSSTADMSENLIQDISSYFEVAMRSAFLDTDSALLAYTLQATENLNEWGYTSSTGVVALTWLDHVTVGNIGDSRGTLCQRKPNPPNSTVNVNTAASSATSSSYFSASSMVESKWITRDHKPNDIDESKRIEKHGGCVVYLHGSKPYLRGGDFYERQTRRERPIQLNYSRAFGGRNLKPYGLIADPLVRTYVLDSNDVCMILGSDGLWDSVHAKDYCAEVVKWIDHKVPAMASKMCDLALTSMIHSDVVDNVSGIVVTFHNLIR